MRVPGRWSSRQQLSLGTLRCGSWLEEVDDLSYAGIAGGVPLDGTMVPIVEASACRYVPQLRMVVGPDGMVPLESIQRQWDFHHHWGQRSETIRFERQVEVRGPVCVLSTPWSFVFGHWVSEELVKVFLLERAGLNVRYVVHVDEESNQYRMQRFMIESLDALGVSPDRLILGFGDADLVIFDSMVFPPAVNEGRALHYRPVYDAYREAILPPITTHPEGASRVWVQRREGAQSGRLGQTNEAETEALVERYGFRTVDLGALGFLDQVAVARSASIFAGIHGSAFVHVLFQARHSAVVECFAPDHVNPSVLTFCRLRQHRYHMIVPASAYDHEPGAPWSIDLKHLDLVLADLHRSSA